MSSGCRRGWGHPRRLRAGHLISAWPRWPARHTGPARRYRLAADRQAPTAARAALMGQLDGELPELTRDAAALMITEVVSNAVLHGCASARDEVVVDVRAGARTIAIAVRDPGAGAGDPELDRHGGYGLGIVDQLATRWGMEQESASTVVWFELAV